MPFQRHALQILAFLLFTPPHPTRYRWARQQWQQRGLWGFLKSLASIAVFGTHGEGAARVRGGLRAGQGQAPANQRERLERVAEALQKLPTAVIASRGQLEVARWGPQHCNRALRRCLLLVLFGTPAL